MDNGEFSPIVLLHPDGFIHHSLVIGSCAPARLASTGHGQLDLPSVDLILWAPSIKECQQRNWFQSTSVRICELLAPDGLVYALIPARWRFQAQSALRIQGLDISLSLVHLPDWSKSHHWVPLKTGPADYVFNQQFSTHPLIRIAGLTALRSAPGRVLVEFLYPSVAFVARPRGSRYLFEWFFQEAGISPKNGMASMTVSWKSERCSVVIHGYDRRSIPKIVAKTIVGNVGQYEYGDEYNILESLGPAARKAGAQVPIPFHKKNFGNYSVFLQSFLQGTCSAATLAGHPERISFTIEHVMIWLAAWNQSTAIYRKLDEQFLYQTLLVPLEVVASYLPDSKGYRIWLTDCFRKLPKPMILVDAHNDLTLWNILQQSDGTIGIVDWREARHAALPLTDLFYLFVDTVSVTHRYNYMQAFLECIEPDGMYHRLFRTVLTRMRVFLDLPTSLINLSLHACFLHHAANELQENQVEADHPFLQILCWLEKNREVLIV